MTATFNYTHGTVNETIMTEIVETNFYNLKNRNSVRRYGFTLSVKKYSSPEGQTVFCGTMQTTVDGANYQSAKDARWFATSEEAEQAIRKMVAASIKRYTKLATDPKNKIEQR